METPQLSEEQKKQLMTAEEPQKAQDEKDKKFENKVLKEFVPILLA